MQNEDIENLISEGIPGCKVKVGGDGTHFEAIIVSDQFAGKTMVQQHQLVYQALGEKMGNEIHALSIQTYTETEWENKKDLRII